MRTKAKLTDVANEHMFMLKKSPHRVESFFQDFRSPESNTLQLERDGTGRQHKAPETQSYEGLLV